ncbi:MAG: methyltransferase domain-containing protein [Alphaproteobacteria bacterium]|nr:methyltransferase domain-containing protein [Alphaproteobacteria bacterium]
MKMDRGGERDGRQNDAPGEDFTDDAFLGGRLQALQPRKGFRAGLDTVFLAAAIAAGEGARVLELGAGAGIAALCLALRTGASVMGIEREPWLANLACENARRNGLAERVAFACADALNYRTDRPFDVVMANPPYNDARHGTPTPIAKKRGSVLHEGGGIAAWVKAAHENLKPGGAAYFIYRADRGEDLLRALATDFAQVLWLPLMPREGEQPRRVIIRARMAPAAPLRRVEGFVLHGQITKYTPQAEAILRHGAALDLETGQTGSAIT